MGKSSFISHLSTHQPNEGCNIREISFKHGDEQEWVVLGLRAKRLISGNL